LNLKIGEHIHGLLRLSLKSIGRDIFVWLLQSELYLVRELVWSFSRVNIRSIGLGNNLLVGYQGFARLQATGTTAKPSILIQTEETLLMAMMFELSQGSDRGIGVGGIDAF
jgi:hypothetical protein